MSVNSMTVRQARIKYGAFVVPKLREPRMETIVDNPCM